MARWAQLWYAKSMWEVTGALGPIVTFGAAYGLLLTELVTLGVSSEFWTYGNGCYFSHITQTFLSSSVVQFEICLPAWRQERNIAIFWGSSHWKPWSIPPNYILTKLGLSYSSCPNLAILMFIECKLTWSKYCAILHFMKTELMFPYCTNEVH